MSILKFLTPKTECKAAPKTALQNGCKFRSFDLKQGMKLAPVTRLKPFSGEEAEKFDMCIGISKTDCAPTRLYLEELKSGLRRPHFSKRTAFAQPEIVILPNDHASDLAVHGRKRRKKLLQFHENQRPSKYGVWRAISRKVSGRRPFAKDETVFNYDVDSDDEWEDEGEGDDCKSDEDDGSEIDPEVDEEDKEFFVAHGYLSASENGSDEEDGDPESRREHGKAKLLTFEADMESRKAKRLRLIQHGPYWPTGNLDVDDLNWSLKLAGFKVVLDSMTDIDGTPSLLTLSATKPIPSSFTPGVQKLATPLRSVSSKTPRTEKKASVKRKMRENADGAKESKKAALSLS